MSYSKSTIFNFSDGFKAYIEYCRESDLVPFPLKTVYLELFIISKVKEGKSFQNVSKYLSSINFVAQIFGFKNYSQSKSRNLRKYAEKMCSKPNRQKSSFNFSKIKKLMEMIDKNGGIKSLSVTEFRTLNMVIFSHQTLCRYSDLSAIKVENLKFKQKYFKILIPFSKTDQAGNGQTVVLPYLNEAVNPHMMFCLYLNGMDFRD